MTKREIQMRIVCAVLTDLMHFREGSGDEISIVADLNDIDRNEALFKSYKKQIIGILTDEEEK